MIDDFKGQLLPSGRFTQQSHLNSIAASSSSCDKGQLNEGQGMAGRIAWVDAARGIGIILVVAGHAERGLAAARVATGSLWAHADLWLYTFHMPLFMLLAGINVPRSLCKGTVNFLKGKLSTILYPYLLWSLIQGSIMVMLSGLTNTPKGWLSLVQIGWQPISPFWFLYALFVFMLVVAIVRHSTVLVGLAGLGLVASYFFVGESVWHQMAYMFQFFVFGAVAADGLKQLSLPAYSVPVFGLVSIATASFIPDGPTPYLTPIALPAAIAGVGMTIAIAQVMRGPLQRVLVALGEASMSIYVMHILATAGTRIILTKLHLPLPAVALWLICTITGIVAPFITHVVLKRFELLPLLGLGSRTTKAQSAISFPPSGAVA